MTPPRVAVLLGAGASADAGLPLTNELAAALVDAANERGSSFVYGGNPETLNRVYGAMVGHESARGGNPRAAVNIERLISSVRLLANREAHEVAPFVASWIQSVRNVSERDYARLEDWMLKGVRALLSDVKDVSYLRPLGELAKRQVNGLDILTLNYDLTVELMAAKCDVRVDTGVERWRPSVPLVFKSATNQINLYKLHGSIDWTVRRRPTAIAKNQLDGVQIHRPDISSSTFWRTVEGLPWIVIGDREKLSTDGPTLDLLTSAKAALNRARRLVVVGYSFGDLHINQVIRDWLLGRPNRQLTVLDVSWHPTPGTIQADLQKHLAMERRAAPRLNVIELSAKAGLGRALEEPPQIYGPMLTVTLVENMRAVILAVDNEGGDIRRLDIAVFGGPLAGIITPFGDEGERSTHVPGRYRAYEVRNNVGPGESAVIELDSKAIRSQNELGIHIDAYTLFEHFEFYFTVPIASRDSIQATTEPGWTYADGIG